MNKHISSIFISIMCFFLLNEASAHDTWLLPKVFRMKPEQHSQLMFTSGMIFPQNNYAIKPERIDKAFVLLAGEKTQMTKRESAPKALKISVMPPNVGVATAFVELTPKSLELTPKLVREYLGEAYVIQGKLELAKEQLQIIGGLCGNTDCEEYEDLEQAIVTANVE